MDALRWVDVPGYAALVLRRTYSDLSLPGAIMDRAGEWLRPTSAEWNDQKKTWTFPSGARLTFGYLDTEQDKYRYQGAEFQRIYTDELTQFTETQYTYLLSRIRRVVGIDVPLAARGASNPGGIGHDWVHARFVMDPSRAFVPAKLDDNPYLDRDSYRRSLEQLDSTTRTQLLEGVWVRDGAGLLYRYDATRNRAPSVPGGEWEYVLALDLGASETAPTTAFVALAFSWAIPNRVYVVQSFAEAGLIPSTMAERIFQLQETFPFARIVIDEGALGKGYGGEFRERHGIAVEPAQKANKLGYRKLLNGALERGDVLLVERQNDALVEELGKLPWNAAGTDNEKGFANHLTDALLYGWRECKAFAAEAPASKPRPSDPDYLDQVAREIEREERETAERARSGQWWEAV